MADDTTESKPGNGACQSLKTQYRTACCDNDYFPPEVAQAPTPAPFIKLPQGSEPVCNVCKDGRYPGIPSTVLAILDVPGNPTCGSLYEMGLKGLILDRLCQPIQKYRYLDCGCNLDGPVVQGPVEIQVDGKPRETIDISTTRAPTKAPNPSLVIVARDSPGMNFSVGGISGFSSLGNKQILYPISWLQHRQLSRIMESPTTVFRLALAVLLPWVISERVRPTLHVRANIHFMLAVSMQPR